MRHITPEKLERLSSLLEELRQIGELREKKPGVFYRKSKAFLHFHEDPRGLFADLRLSGPDFERFDVSSRADQRALARRIRDALGPADAGRARSRT